ncbi:hypothetical protein K432DRAFT_381101 [Lepidopterella palustris CBS 459.81]|uniref:Uncharacterized protein n=1 Tax=Lepidopterella palustris CBS 459.81 TaxID=1314670 RepID=A0A8E2ECT9_9PEZI|nr:hypothetical protein K432DRAFT_381101 [Lepidopterella palustris CBS 459.81]
MAYTYHPHSSPPALTLEVQDFLKISGIFTDRELLITESSASNVVAKVSLGELTALEVTEPVSKRADVAQQLINCVTEICFDAAIARAKELGAVYQSYTC